MGFLSSLRDQIQAAGSDLDRLREKASNTEDVDAYDALLEEIALRQSELAKANEAMERAAEVSVSGVKELLGGLVTQAQETVLVTDQMFEDWLRSGSLNAVDQAMLDMEINGEQRLATLARGAAALAEQVREIPSLIYDGVLSFEDLKANTDSYILEYIDPMIDRTGELRKQLRETLGQASRIQGQINETVVALRGAESLQEKIAGAMSLLADGTSDFSKRLAAGLRDLESGKISADELLSLIEQVQKSLGSLQTGGPTAFDNLAELLKDIARQAEREDYDTNARGGIY